MLTLTALYGPAPELKVWKFPCGEVGVKVENASAVQWSANSFRIDLTFEGNDDLFALAQLVDIIRNEDEYIPACIYLYISYLPYSRQDRRVNKGEAHALKVFGNFLNALELDKVYTLDVHSTVSEAVIDKLFNFPQHECALMLPHDFEVFVAPDAGAEKKIFQLAHVKVGAEVICASKVRNSLGKITSTFLPFGGKVTGKKVCVVDDLCDGGATFLELGKVIKEYEPAEMCLYVTHGMFTNGEKFVELNDLYDRIFVHNLHNKNFAGYVEQI